jgi:hypothetical protein
MRGRTESRGRGLLPVLFAMLLAFLAGFPRAGIAQIQTTTGITGTVTDSSGGAVIGAVVTVKDQTTGAKFDTKTNNSGVYSFPSLLPGLYTITATFTGFSTAVVTDRQILATQPATVDIVLQVGQAGQSITVSAQGAELLNTASQAVTGTITPELVKALPNIQGNFFDLLILAPGVVSQNANQFGFTGISQTADAFNYVQMTNTKVASGAFVGGNRDTGNNVSVDGSNVQSPRWQATTQLQSSDSVQELRVETANMSAEFGYGVAGVNVITKSGTNRYHGDVYEYLRNTALDATDFFSNLNGQSLPRYQQNMFGASVGGPVLKDKLLFFFNYEGLRVRQAANVQAPMVSDAYRGGDFSANEISTSQNPVAPIPIYNPYQYDPATGLRQPFPGNRIPLGDTTLCAPNPTCGDPATLAFLNKYVLHPNARRQDGSPILLANQSTYTNADQFTARADWLQSSKTMIYGRYTQTPYDAASGSFEPLGGLYNPHASYNGVVHWTQTFNANAVNHFFVGVTRSMWAYGRNLNAPDVSTEIGLKNASTLPGGPDFAGTPYDMDAGGQNISRTIGNSYQLQDDLSMVRGRHNLKVGVSLIDRRAYITSVGNDKGFFNFTGAYTAACPLGNATCEAARVAAGLPQGGNSFADYLLGASSQNSLNVNPAPYAGYQLYSGFYVQDSWRATSKLTVNAGLRYEHWTPWLVPRNTVSTFDSARNPAWVLQNPLDYLSASACYGACGKLNPNVPRAGYKTRKRDFAPRLGLAYRLTPSTVLRASFGIYFDGNELIAGSNAGAAPFSLTFSQPIIQAETPVPTYTVSTMFPNSAVPAGLPQPNTAVSYSAVWPDMQTPTVDQWSANVEQRVGKIWALDVSYTGNHTLHELQTVDLNAPALPQGDLATLQQRRPNPAWGGLTAQLPIGYGRYNAMLASFKNTNPWHGLTFLNNFQWTKNLVSSFWSRGDGNEDFRTPYMWEGDYTIFPPVRFVSGYSYHLPFGRGKAMGSSLNPVLSGLVSGWQVSGMTTFARGGGSPFYDYGPNTTGTGLPNMPNRTCNPNKVTGVRDHLQWINMNCFSPSAFGTYGDSPISAYSEPGINNWDLSIQKNTRVGFPKKDEGEIEFRFQMFNAFNHTQLGSGIPYIDNWGGGDIAIKQIYGQIYTTRPPRQIEVALKYTF